ncbi:MAG: MerR family transcriptional regulator [Pleomorphochaeta sp.]
MLDKFSIGQLAAMFNINIQTLYYYDKIGLLIPSFRNTVTGVRSYSFKQVQQLSTILYLKKCGFSLEEIKDIESNLTPETARTKLIEKSEEMMKQWKEIVKLDTALHKNIKYVDNELMLVEKNKHKIMYRKKRYFLEIGGEETAYGTEDLYYYPLVVCYFGCKKVFGALFDKKNEISENEGTINTILNGNFLVEYHYGSYDTIYEHQREIMKNHPELNFTDNVYTFDIVDQMNCSKIEDFVTKMEFQLK